MTDIASTGPGPTDTTSMPTSTTISAPSDPSATVVSQASSTAVKMESIQDATETTPTEPHSVPVATLPVTDAAPSTDSAAPSAPPSVASGPATGAATATVESIEQPSTGADESPAPVADSTIDATALPGSTQPTPTTTAPTQVQPDDAPTVTTTVASANPMTTDATTNVVSSYISSTPSATPSAAAQHTPAADSTARLLASNSYKPSTADVGDDAVSEVASTQPGSPTGKRGGRLTNQLQHLSKAVVPLLFKHDFAWPFRKPVDWKKLNLPTYPEIVKHPMDLSTIKKKLQKKEYYSAKECIADIALIWRNCQTFNREQDDVFKMSHTLQEEFERLLKSMPEEEIEIVRPTAASRKVSTASLTTPAAFAPPSRRQSSRSIKAPARTLSSDTLGRGNRELRACSDIIKELFHKRHADYAWPFLEPVDVVKLNLPDYYDVIKEPMDLATVKRNLEAGYYDTADAFARDVRLVFSNCYNYNPPGSDVVKMANSTSQVFEMQFAALKSGTSLASVKTTSRRRVDSSSSGSSSDSSDDDATAMQVQHLQTAIMGAYQQLQAISGGSMPMNMGMLPTMPKKKKKSKKHKKHKKHKSKRQHETVYDYEEEDEEYRAKRPKQRTSRPAQSSYGAGGQPVAMQDDSDGDSDNGVLPMTWDEKRLLSQNIKLLPAHMLHHIVDIVKSCEPSMRNTSSDEIEIDFDELRPKTLRELDRFVKDSLPNEGARPRQAAQSQAAEREREALALAQERLAQERASRYEKRALDHYVATPTVQHAPKPKAVAKRVAPKTKVKASVPPARTSSVVDRQLSSEVTFASSIPVATTVPLVTDPSLSLIPEEEDVAMEQGEDVPEGWENEEDDEADAMETLSTLSGPTDNLDKQFEQFRSQQHADEVREKALQDAEERRQQELARLEEERIKALELAEKQRLEELEREAQAKAKEADDLAEKERAEREQLRIEAARQRELLEAAAEQEVEDDDLDDLE